MRILLMAVLTATLLALVAGQAGAALPEADDGDADSGSVLESPSTSTAGLQADTIVDEGPIETYAASDSSGESAASYKCRSAKVAYVKKTLFGFVAYKFWMRRSWCWRYPRLVSVSTYTYVTDNDGTNTYKGIIASSGRWFQWCCKEPRSGHVAFRQASFENCILKYGCLSTTYPWIRMAVHGNGSYTYSIGD